jgi:branched-chain amino acid transport system substrate-binding protein
MDAYFKYVNDTEGGVNGRKLELDIQDDSYQPAKAVAAAKKLVEDDKVFALAGPLGTASNLAAMPYLTKAGIPVVAIASGSAEFANPFKKNYFAIETTAFDEGKAMAKYAKEKLNAQKVGIFYQNDDMGKGGKDGGAEKLKEFGMKFVAETTFNVSDVDFSTQALQMKEANPDVVLVYASPKGAASFMKEMSKLSFKPKYMVTYAAADQSMFDMAGDAFEGAIVSHWLPVLNVDDTKYKQFVEAMKKYYPQENPKSVLAMSGWMFGEVAIEGLRRTGNNLTWDNYIKALETIKDWNGLIASHVTYGSDDRQGLDSVTFYKAENKQFVPISDRVGN